MTSPVPGRSGAPRRDRVDTRSRSGRWPAAAVLLLLAAGAACGDSLPWEQSWKGAFDSARTQGKMVFVDFWASWCGPCREMDQKTFPDPSVARLLSGFVRLKVDVDRSTIARTHRVTSFPTYVVFDPWENERFRFSGFDEAPAFARKLDVVRIASPEMLEAGRALSAKESPDPYLLIGRTYLKVKATADAREAFVKCRKLAEHAGNGDLAQKARIEEAMTWALEGEGDKAIGMLRKIAAKPADAECAAAAWLSIGHVERLRRDLSAAAEAYRHAIDACDGASPLKREAEASLAAVQR